VVTVCLPRVYGNHRFRILLHVLRVRLCALPVGLRQSYVHRLLAYVHRTRRSTATLAAPCLLAQSGNKGATIEQIQGGEARVLGGRDRATRAAYTKHANYTHKLDTQHTKLHKLHTQHTQTTQTIQSTHKLHTQHTNHTNYTHNTQTTQTTHTTHKPHKLHTQHNTARRSAAATTATRPLL
jgi:hypothetical protein